MVTFKVHKSPPKIKVIKFLYFQVADVEPEKVKPEMLISYDNLQRIDWRMGLDKSERLNIPENPIKVIK